MHANVTVAQCHNYKHALVEVLGNVMSQYEYKNQHEHKQCNRYSSDFFLNVKRISRYNINVLKCQ